MRKSGSSGDPIASLRSLLAGGALGLARAGGETVPAQARQEFRLGDRVAQIVDCSFGGVFKRVCQAPSANAAEPAHRGVGIETQVTCTARRLQARVKRA